MQSTRPRRYAQEPAHAADNQVPAAAPAAAPAAPQNTEFGLPIWIGPLVFVVSTLGALIFLPATRAFLSGFTIVLLFELGLRWWNPNWYRPITVLEPLARRSQTLFDELGSVVAKMLDIIWLSKQFWRFLKWLLPVDLIWQSIKELLTLLFRLVTAPVYLVIGWAKYLQNADSPPVVILTTGLVFTALIVLAGQQYHYCETIPCVPEVWHQFFAKWF